jgi:hypothetical protein
MSLLLSGVAAQAVTVKNLTLDAADSSAPVTADITFGTNGVVSHTGGSYNWFVAPLLNVGNDYEIYAEVTATPLGSFFGTLGAWLPLTSAQAWSLTIMSGNTSGTLQISIRKAGSALVLATGSTVFNAEVTT